MGNKMSNPYIEANIEFAERLVESLAPRVTNGTGSQLTLTAGEVGALKAILEGFLDNQDLEHDKDFAEKTGLEWSRLACEYRARVEGLENGLFALVPKTPTENMMLNGLIVVSLGIGKTDIRKEIAMTWEKMIEGAKP